MNVFGIKSGEKETYMINLLQMANFYISKMASGGHLDFYQHRLAKYIKQHQKWTPHTLKPQKVHLSCHILRNKSK